MTGGGCGGSAAGGGPATVVGAVSAVLVALLAGCTPGAPAPEVSSGAAGTTTGAATTSPPAAATGATTAVPTSPGALSDAELLGAFQYHSDEDPTRSVRDFQEKVAACMHDAGFEYTPDVPDQTTTDPGPSPAPGEEEEWAATWGFGISIDMSPLYADAPPLRPDPNADYVASLSPAGRQAYDDALQGTLHEGERPTGKPGELGCYVESYDEPTDLPTVPDLVTELQEQVLAAMYDTLGTDPRVADAVSDLQQCAADAGDTGFDPYAETGVQVGVGDTLVSPPFTSWSAYEYVDAAWQELTAGGEPDAAALERFQRWERDTAVAEIRCNAPLRELTDQIGTEVTHDLVAPHRAELEDLLSTWDGAVAPSSTSPWGLVAGAHAQKAG